MDMTINQIIIIAIIGVFAGVVSGSLGVGGGVIIIPALVYFLGFSQHTAQGTSLAVLSIPVALVASINYYKSGFVDIKVALILVLAFVIGGYVSSLYAVNVSGKVLKQIFAILMIIMGVKMLFGK